MPIATKPGRMVTHSVHPPPPPTPFCSVEPPTKFSQRGGLRGSQFLERELLGKRGVTFFRRGGVQFLHEK